MRALAYTAAIAALLVMAKAKAQTPYPDHTIQDVSWNSGTHHFAVVTQHIIAPGTPILPVLITGTADADFVSGSRVRLAPGFHAGGFATGGRFRAYIDESLGQPADLIIIAPDPQGALVDNIVHVPKWEKFEVGLRLPQAYQAAVDSFFTHYYSGGPDSAATPGHVQHLYDLNPYADDSLQLVWTLHGPGGQLRMKWGFYMKEAKWNGTGNTAFLVTDSASPMFPYHIRFRFAPDEQGPWQFSLSIKAPHTRTPPDQPLPDLYHTGYSFHCDAPLPDNKGHLSVHEVNRRVLKFENGEPFFGLGVNMADWRRNAAGYGSTYRRRDHEEMLKTMELLGDVGGNFMRMFLMDKIFSPEYVNLGVYDHFKVPVLCALSESTDPQQDCDRGWINGLLGNCQNQCWAFDGMLDQARTHNIYLQLCIDPYPPVIAYEKMGWGAHPYKLHFLDKNRQNPPLNAYNMREFFYEDGDPANKGAGTIFYYWMRRYKYIMSRWGWSVNLPIIEPFNEIDQMLSYRELPNDSLGSGDGVSDCSQVDDTAIAHRDICRENRGQWLRDDGLPLVLDQWLSDIADYTRGEANFQDPVSSPLGEGKKLFMISYTDARDATHNGNLNVPHYLPFTNPKIDLIDVHKGAFMTEQTTEWAASQFIRHMTEHAERFWSNYPQPNAPQAARKPINHGESQHYTSFNYSGKHHDLLKYFHNYDIAFHTELWSSAFSGKFAAGTTWHWERVFWWPDALETPPPDPQNPFSSLFTNELGQPNHLWVSNADYHVVNKRTHHHFKPLADLLNHPSWLAYDFFGQDFRVRRNEDFSGLDVYYLQNKVPPYDLANVAIGWVQNRNASLYNNYYLHSGRQRFFECTPPAGGEGSTTWLSGFEPGTYHISWFPTRLNSTVHPPDGEVATSISGAIELDLTGHFGGIFNNFLDTLRSDYAFIITPLPFVKSLMQADEPEDLPIGTSWDFLIHPNPTRGEFTLRFPDDGAKDIAIMDLTGRLVARYASVTGAFVQFPHLHLSQGAYWVRASDGQRAKAKQLIIY
ncbi:MAG: T9SS type A sorting domain-containing protein [Flavobacteriales bacterium]|nr:T9SS type A sorting domain-containing protein [Flavobacteriales bacterium]